MKDQESSSSWRWPGFAESVAAGLVANIITAACVVIVALLGGRLKALQAGLALLFLLLVLAMLLFPIYVWKARMADENFGHVIVGSVLYALVFGTLVWTMAE